MAIQKINTEKWLVFINGEIVQHSKNEAGQETTYNDSVWTAEEYTTEEAWLIRLLDFDIVPE